MEGELEKVECDDKMNKKMKQSVSCGDVQFEPDLPRLQALHVRSLAPREVPPWPHPSEEQTASVRYMLQCEPERIMGFLDPQGDEVLYLREASQGCRLSVAAAWFRLRPREVWQELAARQDPEETSSSDYRTPPHSVGSGEASVDEEYERAHAFNAWDPLYRPDVVRQRVETWRRNGRRRGWEPDVEGLSQSENAGVQLMVGYFLYERPPSDRSSTPSPPALRMMSVVPESPDLCVDGSRLTADPKPLQQVPGQAEACQALSSSSLPLPQVPGQAEACQALSSSSLPLPQVPGQADSCQALSSSSLPLPQVPGQADACQALPSKSVPLPQVPGQADSCQAVSSSSLPL